MPALFIRVFLEPSTQKVFKKDGLPEYIRRKNNYN